jgi:hypothetical protein
MFDLVPILQLHLWYSDTDPLTMPLMYSLSKKVVRSLLPMERFVKCNQFLLLNKELLQLWNYYSGTTAILPLVVHWLQIRVYLATVSTGVKKCSIPPK